MLGTLFRNACAAASSVLAVGGCANFNQDAYEVLIRDPRVGRYADPSPAQLTAEVHWEYAAMSYNAYQKHRAAVIAKGTEFARTLPHSENYPKETFAAACADESMAIPLQGWQKWDFPSGELQAQMLRKGMYLEVLERAEEPHTIVVVFEGTNFSEWSDWKANLRWFLRFIPGFKDHYTLAAQQVAKEFFDVISSTSFKYQIVSPGVLLSTSGNTSGNAIRIVATGHSLGGGLAQHFAYAFMQVPSDNKGPKVSEVFAFDPSPVTGWFSLPDPPRGYNAEGLVINRIFEHGEVLAYARLLTSRLAVTSENPAIWEYRYNFDPRINIVRNHSMRRLACGLAVASKRWVPK